MTDHKDEKRYIKIEGRQVENGMYVHALHCSWLDNPFWRNSFLITHDRDRDQIREHVPHATIDLSRGRGPMVTPVTGECIPEPAEIPIDPPAAPIAITTNTTPKRARRRKPLSEVERVHATAARTAASVAELFREARLGKAIRTCDLMPMVEDIARATVRGNATMIAVTRLKTQDRHTYVHSVAVGAMMMGLARHLGFSDDDIHVAGMAGLLHDIGKTHIAAAIVDKPGALTREELREMRRHPVLGYHMLLDIDDLDPRILDVCRHHHERMDGTGYPDELKGPELSRFVRMAAVCDVYDAITSIRSYKSGWSPHEALAQMAEWHGHFDATMLDALIASLGIQPYGALVRLHSNRLGVVVREGDSPQTPVVRIFFDVPDQRRIMAEDIATADDPILRSERGAYWFGEEWPRLLGEMMADSAAARAPFAEVERRRALG
ncbi:HD-GYP domain-containing protein [Sphingomonadaceae bacterium jetA1]|jgi:putative nucleotidyltransferase with HDIG domain|uniref:HD-GYP domain-containing protein n=1 Tax=Facivitalis istanbulensis TaxID=3075838 RepID=UPI00346A2689